MPAKAKNTRRGASGPSLVLVVGDVTLDWLEEGKPRSQPQPGKTLRNYQLFPGFHWTCVWGGAALVQRFLEEAIKSRRHRRRFVVDRTLVKELPNERSPDAAKYLQSLAIIQRMIKDPGKPVRVVEPFKGFSVGSPQAPMSGLVPDHDRSLACLVIDDAADGCRDDDEFVAKIA